MENKLFSKIKEELFATHPRDRWGQGIPASELRVKFRAKAIEVLGGVCSRCKTSDVRVLEFDHVIPISKLRKTMTSSQLYRIRDVIFPEFWDFIEKGKIQLLCSNCNKLKRIENKEDAQKRRRIKEPTLFMASPIKNDCTVILGNKVAFQIIAGSRVRLPIRDGECRVWLTRTEGKLYLFIKEKRERGRPISGKTQATPRPRPKTLSIAQPAQRS